MIPSELSFHRCNACRHVHAGRSGNYRCRICGCSDRHVCTDVVYVIRRTRKAA